MYSLMAYGLWWTFDDHLAEAVATPGLGELEWWVVLLAVITIGFAAGAEIESHVRRLKGAVEKQGGKG